MHAVTLLQTMSSRTRAAQRKSQPTSTTDFFADLNMLAMGEVDVYSPECSPYNLKELCDLESVVYGDIDEGSIDF